MLVKLNSIATHLCARPSVWKKDNDEFKFVSITSTSILLPMSSWHSFKHYFPIFDKHALSESACLWRRCLPKYWHLSQAKGLRRTKHLCFLPHSDILLINLGNLRYALYEMHFHTCGSKNCVCLTETGIWGLKKRPNSRYLFGRFNNSFQSRSNSWCFTKTHHSRMQRNKLLHSMQICVLWVCINDVAGNPQERTQEQSLKGLGSEWAVSKNGLPQGGPVCLLVCSFFGSCCDSSTIL